MKNITKSLTLLLTLATLSIPPSHTKDKQPNPQPTLLTQAKNLFTKAKNALTNKLQPKKEKILPKKKKKSNKLLITLCITGSVAIIGGGIYWKFSGQTTDHTNTNDNPNTIHLSNAKALKQLMQSNAQQWFNGHNLIQHVNNIFQRLEKKKNKGQVITKKNIEKELKQILKEMGVDFEAVGEESDDGNTIDTTSISGVDDLKKIMDNGKGKVFNGKAFHQITEQTIKKLKTNGKKVSVDNLKVPIIQALVNHNIDITKKNENSTTGAYYFINHIAEKDGFLTSGLLASDTATILDILVQLAIGLKGKGFVLDYMLNEQDKQGNTVLHHLINHCGSLEDTHTSRGTNLNCTKHMETLMNYGADPTIKNNAHQSAIDLGKEKTIRNNKVDYYLEISFDENNKWYVNSRWHVPSNIQSEMI